MSGNYDHPPASHRPSRGSGPSERPQRPNIARLHHLRDLLTSERNRNSASTARALDALNQEISEYRSDRSRDRPNNFDQAREAVDRQIQQLQSDLADRQERIRNIFLGYDRPSQAPTTVNPSAMNQDPDQSGRPSRRRGQGRPPRSGRPLRRDTPISSQPFEPSPQGDSPTIMPRVLESGRPLGRWRSKRRKLESDDNREGLRGFGYGQYGQVVPGVLKMEIASCDGRNSESGAVSSWPENILRNDQSVYNAKSDRCNLILKHRGEAPFCLKKIVIRAAWCHFDTPIQEGMVFVSMTSDELLARTAQHRVQSSNGIPRRLHRRGSTQPYQEYMTTIRSPLQSLERVALSNPDPRSDSTNDLAISTGQNGTTTVNQASGARVTTYYGESPEDGSPGEQENDDEHPTVSEIERLQMEQMEQIEDDFLCSESDDSDSDDTTELSMFHRRRRELLRHIRDLEEAAEQSRRQDPNYRARPVRYYPEFDSPNREFLRPNARFFIEQSKRMVSIKFDPPVSGRFILIKLWNPQNTGTIDIQSIVAHGFAGPRFFPAGQFR